MRIALLIMVLIAASTVTCKAQNLGAKGLEDIPEAVRHRYNSLIEQIGALSPPKAPVPYPGNVAASIGNNVSQQVVDLAAELQAIAPRVAMRLLEDWRICLSSNGYSAEDQMPWLERARRMSVDAGGCWRLRLINQQRRSLFIAMGRQQDAIAAAKDTGARCLEALTVERPYLKTWLEIDLARELLFEVHRPLEALQVIDRAMRAIDTLASPWPEEVVARLRENLNIYITDRNRMRAATYEDTKGQAQLIRGMVKARLGMGQDSVRDFEEAAELFAVSGNQHRRLNCRHNTAEALYDLGRLREATVLAAKVREEYRRFRFADGEVDRGGPPQMDKILGHIARAEGKWKRACELYDACFEGFGRVTRAEYLASPRDLHYHAMESLMYAAECRIRMGDTMDARQDLALVVDYYSREGNRLRAADAQRIRALLAIESGDLEDAIHWIRTAESTFQRYEQLPLLTQCALTKGHILQQQGDHGGAIESFADSANYLLKGMNDQTITQSEDASHAYRLMYRPALDGILKCLVELGEPTSADLDAAYRAVQVFHGFGLVGALNSQSSGDWMQQLPQPEKDNYLLVSEDRRSVFGKWREMATKRPVSLLGIKQKADKLEELENQLSTLDATIQAHRTAAYSRLARHPEVVRPQPSNLTDVATTLGRNTVFLEFVSGDTRLHAFVFRGSKLDFVSIAGLEKIHELVEALHMARDIETTEQALKQLSRLILDPLASYVQPDDGKKLLLVSPDGDLCAVPFAALTTPGDEKRLIESWNLAYVHSGTVYKELVGQRLNNPSEAKHRLAGFGDPIYKASERDSDSWRGSVDLGRLKPLPGTREELQSIARVMEDTGGEATLFLGEFATEKNMRESIRVRNATIIHLACHGLANRKVPSLSLLALSPEGDGMADATDGLLLSRELRELNLHPQLMVLSACETNVGELRNFEGMLGLTRAVIASGTQAVLSTLWRIPDEESTRLIIDFYTNWIANGLDRPRALAQAQRAAIQRGASISSWAAFTLWDIDR